MDTFILFFLLLKIKIDNFRVDLRDISALNTSDWGVAVI